MNFRSHFNQLLIIDAFFEGGRMFVGATSVTYLLFSGLTLSQIAFLKSIQAVTVLLGEVPTGVLADSLGRKKSLLASALCAILGFACYYWGGGFDIFIFAEVLTALSLCLWSGAFEAFAIEEAKLEHAPGQIDKFFHLNQSIDSAAVLICGMLGGLLGNLGLASPYLSAIVFYLVMFWLIWRVPETFSSSINSEKIHAWKFTIKTHLANTVTQGLLHPALMPFFIANILIQFILQPLLHYWQPYFQSIDPQLGTQQQGLIFAAYCGTSAFFGAIYAKYSHHRILRSFKMTITLFFIFSILYYFMGFKSSWLFALVVFSLLQGILSIARTSLNVRMNENIDPNSRASILSSLSLISRLGMVGALATIGHILSEKDMGSSLFQIFRYFGIGSIAVSFLIIIGSILTHRKKNAI